MKTTTLIALFLIAGAGFVQSQNNSALVGSWTAASKTAKIYFMAGGKGFQTMMKSSPIHENYICNSEYTLPFTWFTKNDTLLLTWDSAHYSVKSSLVATTSQTLTGNPLKILTEACTLASDRSLPDFRRKIPIKTKNRFSIEGSILNYGTRYTRD